MSEKILLGHGSGGRLTRDLVSNIVIQGLQDVAPDTLDDGAILPRQDNNLVRWKLAGDDLIAIVRHPDGSVTSEKDNDRWVTDEKGVSIFWGLDNENHAVMWEKGTDRKVWTFIMGSGWKESSGGPIEYIPLKKGFIRGDPGVSLRTGRPVSKSIFVRLRNLFSCLVFLAFKPTTRKINAVIGNFFPHSQPVRFSIFY